MPALYEEDDPVYSIESQLSDYVESELNATRPRFRITESNFKAQLLAKLHEVIAKYIDHFPEDGRLFANV